MNPAGGAMDEPLSMSVERRAGATVVALRGASTMEQSEEIRARLLAVLEERPGVVVLDLSGLSFIESTGLGSIVAAHIRARRAGAVIRMVNPTPAIRELLRTTRLTELFGVYSDVSAAVAAPVPAQ
ncbi:MAG: STAS domain-containing protein [Phycisphaerae bacterium]